MPLVEIARFHTVASAELARLRLAADDVPSAVFDAGFSGLWGGGPGVRLMTPDAFEDQARGLLEDEAN